MNILIVDDDPNIIVMIQKIVDWKSLGIQNVLSAYNGEYAKEIILNQKPEIVLCDIEMPICDGIEVLEWIGQNKIETYFIFLTCHESFSLIQRALRLGARDYITKPFPEPELKNTLKKAIQVIEYRKRKQEKENHLERFHNNWDYANYGFVWKLLQSSTLNDRITIEKEIVRRGIEFDVTAPYYILYAGIPLEKWQDERMDREEAGFIFSNITTELFGMTPSYDKCAEFEVKGYYFLVLLLPETDDNIEALKSKYEILKGQIKKYLHTSVCCILSEAVYCEEMAVQKKMMDDLIATALLQSDKMIICGEEKNTRFSAEEFDVEVITKALRNKEKITFLGYIKSYTNTLQKEGCMNSYQMHVIHQQLQQVFYSYFAEVNISVKSILHDVNVEEMDRLAEQSVYDMTKYVSYMFDLCVNVPKIIREDTSIVAQAKKYIETHFKEDINRESIAEYVYITPNYLSKIFHRETDMTLREYINLCRVNEAMRLMSTTSASLSWIALESGFESAQYFSTVFKKITGVTPNAWKEGNGQ